MRDLVADHLGKLIICRFELLVITSYSIHYTKLYEIVDQYPWVAASLQRAFEGAKQRAYERLQNPRIVPLAWYQVALEEQQALLGEDPWAYGLNENNRHNLQTLISYSHEQGLIDTRFTADELFVETAI